MIPLTALAEGSGSANLAKAEPFIDQALANAEQGKLPQAKQSYERFSNMWFKIEDSVKSESPKAYSDIELNMGQVEYAFTQNNQAEIIKALKGLQSVNEKFIQEKYAKSEQVLNKNLSLGDFINLLKQAKEQVQHHNQKEALEVISNVRQSWLSVEGIVIAQSSSVYSQSERDMVVVNAMLNSNPPKYQDAAQLLDKMIQYLSPLANKSEYTLWDAAMIPLREGMEALLVISALLAFVNKASSSKRKGQGWILLGVSAGLGLSVILAIIVKFIFSSGAFGNNNFLISGWTGVIAAVMLLYMSYWLHNQSHIADWNKYIHTKSKSAIDQGRLISLGLLSFLAVFREGTETVLFFLGMVNQIRLQDLLLGLFIGFGILVLLAYLMLIAGLKLPIRSFFVISSIIVFYLCVKFTGMGIHSLQLAGVLPSTDAPNLPSIDFFALYPSWQSTIPQIVLILLALFVVARRIVNKQREASSQNH
jgi:high-affinity iron transporter